MVIDVDLWINPQ